jgi:PKD repeat protein
MLPTNKAALQGTVIVDGSSTYSGTLATTWSKVSGPGTVTFTDPTALDTTATFSSPGTYQIQLDAVCLGVSASDTSTTYVIPPLTIQASPESGTAPLAVQFTAMDGGGPAANLPEGSSLTWDFGDGSPTATGNPVDHMYNAPGNFTVALTLALTGMAPISCSQKTVQVADAGSVAGVLAVTPSTGLTSSGIQGGPFSPATIQFTLSNPGGSSIDWIAGQAAPSWISISKLSGTLAAKETDTLTVTNQFRRKRHGARQLQRQHRFHECNQR